MNKHLLVGKIINMLETAYERAVIAAEQARETATDGENIAENKYDTLGLEAAYLAHGQSQRAADLKAEIAAFKSLPDTTLLVDDQICVGAIVVLQNAPGDEQNIFLGPGAGGLKVTQQDREFLVVTPSAPLGRAVLGSYVDDEFELLLSGVRVQFTIVAIG